MPTQNNEQTFSIDTFHQGVQRASNPFLVREGELSFGKNIDPTVKIGSVGKAPGYVFKGNPIASGAPVLGAGFLNSSAAANKLIAFAGTDAYVFDSGTGNWTPQSQAYTAGQRYETERLLDQMFEVSGFVDAPRNYNGTDWSTSRNVAGMPYASYIQEEKVRLYLFNIRLPVLNTFYPSRVWYSDLPKNNKITWGLAVGTDLVATAGSKVITSATGLFITRNIKEDDQVFITTGANSGEYVVDTVDSETQLTLTEVMPNSATGQSFWAGSNWFDVDRDNSDVGMGMTKNFDRLLLFKRFSVSKFLKTDQIQTDSLINIPGAPGTTSHRSIANVKSGGYTLYWADTGPWALDSQGGQFLGDAVQEFIDGVDPLFLPYITSWVVRDKIVKFYIGEVNNSETGLVMSKVVLCFDVSRQIWWHEELNDVQSASVDWIDGNAVKTVNFSNTGLAMEMNTGKAHGTAEIPWEVETYPYFAFKKPELVANFVKMKAYGVQLRGTELSYKLVYRDGDIDQDWKPFLPAKQDTMYERLVHFREDTNRAAGCMIRAFESSKDMRPRIDRLVFFYSGGSTS